MIISDIKNKTLDAAIETFGKEDQIIKSVGAMSDLIKELCIALRNSADDTRSIIIQKLAELYLSLEQLERIFDITDEELYEIESMEIADLVKTIEFKEGA